MIRDNNILIIHRENKPKENKTIDFSRQNYQQHEIALSSYII